MADEQIDNIIFNMLEDIRSIWSQYTWNVWPDTMHRSYTITCQIGEYTANCKINCYHLEFTQNKNIPRSIMEFAKGTVESLNNKILHDIKDGILINKNQVKNEVTNNTAKETVKKDEDNPFYLIDLS